MDMDIRLAIGPLLVNIPIDRVLIQFSLHVLLYPGFVSIALDLPRSRETLNVACHSYVHGFTARLKWSDHLCAI